MILTVAEARIALGLASSITDADRGLLEMLLPEAHGAVRKVLGYDPEYKLHSGEFYPRAEVPLREGGARGTWDSNGTVAFFQPHDRGMVLQLLHLPVRSVEELKVDYNGGFGTKPDTFGASTIQVEGTDFYQDLMMAGFNATGHLFSYTGWPIEPGSVKVTYYAGYSQLELAGRADNPDETDADTETTCSLIDASPIKAAVRKSLVHAFKKAKVIAAGVNTNGTVSGILTGERMGDYSYTVSLEAMLAGQSVSVPDDAVGDLEPFVHYGIMLL
jgi:hypothetical protein